MDNLEVISAKNLYEYLNRSNSLIIDMRSQEEYREEHLPGALHIPYEDEMTFYTLPMDKIIVLYCERGSASLVRGREMASYGYQVKSVSNGAQACRKYGMLH